MDVIFDIDGTLADASHRLHFIKDMNHWVAPNGNPLVPRVPDWETFLSDEQVAKDTPIPQTWALLSSMLEWPSEYRVVFVTGRKESTREMTYSWLTEGTCPVRGMAVALWRRQTEYQGRKIGPILYMRSEGDRRPSHEVKSDLLDRVIADGFNPTLCFEDRKDDAAMFRARGLLCCHVAEGDY